MAGRVERRLRPAATPGYWRRHVHKESARNTGSPMAWSAMTNRTPARDRSDALGWRRRTDDFRAIPRSCLTRRAADSDNSSALVDLLGFRVLSGSAGIPAVTA